MSLFRSIAISKRYYSDTLVKESNKFRDKRMYFYAFPITNKKTFVHCRYNDSIFINEQPSLENKLINKFHTLWKQFSTSDAKINQKVVTLVNKFLSKIPWLETCLLSLPSQKFITRKLKDDFKEIENKFLTIEEVSNHLNNEKFTNEDFEKFEFYYPKKITNFDKILKDLKPEFKSQYDIHKKGIFKDLLLMPLTIPFAIVPLIPNIPGFYLLYRIYCHIKVIASLKFFVTLLKDGHLDYLDAGDNITEIYLSSKDAQVRLNILEELSNNHNEVSDKLDDTVEEKILISEDVAEDLCKAFGDEECTSKLLFAIKQERALLEKNKEEGQQSNP